MSVPPMFRSSIGWVSIGVGVLCLYAFPRPASAQLRGQGVASARTYGMTAPSPFPDHEQEISWRVTSEIDWEGGSWSFAVSAFARLASGAESRSRLDFPELALIRTWESWEVIVGLRELFWGVAESSTVIDVVNQLDVGGGPSPSKLGQPLVGARSFREFGTFESYLLPWFRERRFGGRSGLLWGTRRIWNGQARFESAAEERHLDWVLRWSHLVGSVDLGVTHFVGTDRQPRFESLTNPSPDSAVIPRYDQMARTTIDAQWIRGAWLWKLELLRYSSRSERFYGIVGGAEYAFADYLSFFTEYLRDTRGERATTSFQDDFFVGARLLTFDWTISTRAFVDRGHGNLVLSTSAARRLGDAVTVTIDGRLFEGDEVDEPEYAQRLDDSLSVTLAYFF